ncbi:MAG: hypothetical protein AAF757_02725 [Cyanobacteria bacterium P01_D01_bin.116]|mgnify:CR=1 FL=1
MIYVYKIWDFWSGYWIPDTEFNREKIDDSDDKYYMDEETYNLQKTNIPSDGNLAGY